MRPRPDRRRPPSVSQRGAIALRAFLACLVWVGGAVAEAAPEQQRTLVPEREWSDATGMFKVTASLVGIDGDTLTLRQPDGADLTIELGQLARVDRLVALRARRRLARQGTPAISEPVAFAAAAAAGNHRVFPPVAQPLEADPADDSLSLVDGAVAVPRVDRFDRIGRVIAVGGPAALVLVAVENATPGRPLPTRLVWVSLQKKTVLATHLLDSADYVLDYHPHLERLLTISREKFTAEGAARQVLTLWEVAPARKSAEAWLAWKAPCGDGQPLARHPWGRIVDDTLVLHQSSREEYSCWDIDARAARYRLTQYPGHSPMPALSGGRRYLALPDTRRVQICDAVTGAVLVSLPVGDVSGVSFDPAGRRVAIVQEGHVQIHDLGEAAAPIPIFRALAARPDHTAVAWAGDDHLLVQSAEGLAAVLHSASADSDRFGLPIWRYHWQPVQSGDTADDLAVRVVRGRLLYAAPPEGAVDGSGPAADDDSSGSPAADLAVIVAASMPGPQAQRGEETLPGAIAALVEPGTAVATNVSPGPDHDRMIAALAATFERAKWIYDPSSPALVEAGMVAGGTVTYRDAEGRERQLKQVTPTTLRLRFSVHGIRFLEAKLSTDIPDGLVLAAGETEADLAARLPAPGAAWLDRLRLPARFVDVTEAGGLGSTECTARGIGTKGRGKGSDGRPPRGGSGQ